MWRIGDIQLEGRVVLAPLSGYTTPAYREFMKPFGVSLSFTPLVSNLGIIHDNVQTCGFLDTGKDLPTGLQLFGSSPETFSEAAVKALEYNPDISIIDINMACPVKKIIQKGAGSALMRDPKLCGRIVRSVKEAVDIPVTVKIRLGWSLDELTYREVIEETVSAGADAVSLHARTRKDRYMGAPRYDLLEGLRDEMSVPLMISGNIYTPQDAMKAAEITGAEGVMVARGGVGNPFLVTQIDSMFSSGKIPDNPTVSQQADWCKELARMLIEEMGEERAMMAMRSIAPKFVGGCRYCREYRRMLATGITDFASMEGILEAVREKLGDSRIQVHGEGIIRSQPGALLLLGEDVKEQRSADHAADDSHGESVGTGHLRHRVCEEDECRPERHRCRNQVLVVRTYEDPCDLRSYQTDESDRSCERHEDGGQEGNEDQRYDADVPGILTEGLGAPVAHVHHVELLVEQHQQDDQGRGYAEHDRDVLPPYRGERSYPPLVCRCNRLGWGCHQDDLSDGAEQEHDGDTGQDHGSRRHLAEHRYEDDDRGGHQRKDECVDDLSEVPRDRDYVETVGHGEDGAEEGSRGYSHGVWLRQRILEIVLHDDSGQR